MRTNWYEIEKISDELYEQNKVRESQLIDDAFEEMVELEDKLGDANERLHNCEELLYKIRDIVRNRQLQVLESKGEFTEMEKLLILEMHKCIPNIGRIY